MIKHRALLVQEGLSFDELTERIKKKILKYNSIYDSNSIQYKQKGAFTKKATEDLTELDEDLCELIGDFIYDKHEATEEQKKLENPTPPTPPTPDVTVIPKREKAFLGLF